MYEEYVAIAPKKATSKHENNIFLNSLICGTPYCNY